ncbi:pseudouridine synthase, partial [Candidatus Chloroploca sp. Khr17]|uniref:pseudouridine synthase n=1 Tax=Candidatus Chloroploca sp. Khr17 TaxID=2496869 RepID=UPI0013EDDE85
MGAERLQKVLAGAGIASRRDSEGLIAAGRVTVNGRVVQEPGLRVDPEQDVIMLDGEPVRQPGRRTYVLLHKPVGVVSTVEDPHGRPTVIDLVQVPARIFPVGRLDVDSEGLLLLTDDGELTHHLTHPRFEVEKEYRVLLDRPLETVALRDWRNGLLLQGEMTAPARVALAETTDEGVWYSVVLREGRKRQIRETAKTLGYEVRRLIRVREGKLTLGTLPIREYRTLTDEEIAELRTHVPPTSFADEARADDRSMHREAEHADETGSSRRVAAGVAAGAAGAAGVKKVSGDREDRAARRPDDDRTSPHSRRDQRDERGGRGYERGERSYGGPGRDERGGRGDERGYGAGRDERGGRGYERGERSYGGPGRDERGGR